MLYSHPREGMGVRGGVKLDALYLPSFHTYVYIFIFMFFPSERKKKKRNHMTFLVYPNLIYKLGANFFLCFRRLNELMEEERAAVSAQERRLHADRPSPACPMTPQGADPSQDLSVPGAP